MKKILVIDDDHGILESLRFMLEDAGYEVITSDDGKIVHQNLNGEKPDLILMDYWLPKENGGELTKRLKKGNGTKNIPVIIISASLNIKDMVRECGADDFIPKPYDMNFLLAKIKRMVSQ